MAIGTRANKTAVGADRYDVQLRRQLGFLERSCTTFDAGDADEAIRIAVTLRVLLHDTPQSTSLLTHLGIKSSLMYIDTGVYRHLLDPALEEFVRRTSPGDVVASRTPSDVGLVELGDAGGGRVGWYAPLRFERWIPESPFGRAVPGASPFAFWWQTPLVEGTSGASFSRWDLVNIMANQDGGAHVDHALDTDYQDLELDYLGVEVALGQAVNESTALPKALNNVAFASVRQIAFELEWTLARYHHVRNNPGVLALRDPFADLAPPPAPPHSSLSQLSTIVIGKVG